MALIPSTISRFRSTDESLAKQQSPHIVSIHILDDDSLLNMFYFYRPLFLGEDEKDLDRLLGGTTWARGRWWYRLAHVSQRWRKLIFGSASYLRLSLVCTNGTPVEDMLTHSPPLPLTVDYIDEDGITARDEQGILLALKQRHRVRHLRLIFPVQNLRRLVMAIDEEFPILEHLIMYPPLNDNTPLRSPGTLQAPHLRHLTLRGFACAIRSGLHPTAVGLVTLCLTIVHPSAYFQPNILLQGISFMPQLESLEIAFQSPIRNRDLERQLPITTHITLPNLRLFWFRGDSAYLEAVVSRITTPRLETLRIRLFNQLMFSLPRLGQFMNTTENLRFDNAVIMFKDKEIDARISFREADTYGFGVAVECWHLDWQVPAVAQISNGLTQVLSAVEHLTLEHELHSQSSEEQNDVDRMELRNLLRSFNNVKNLRVEDGLVEKLSDCLELEDGEDPLELLPELQVLRYSGIRNTGDAFTSFVDSRQKAGRPVTLAIMQVRREDLVLAKRWVEERKRMAFSSVPNFDRVAPIQSIPESDIQEYQRNLERLDQVLVNMERYNHIAFAALKKGEVVERLFEMMASAKSQLEELKKPIPRYVLELHTIRGMIQEADNMDKILKANLQKWQQAHVIARSGVPSAPPSSSTSALFAQSVAPTTPPATAPVPCPPHAPPLQPAHRKKPSQAQAISIPMPPPIPVTSTPTPQAATPSNTAPSPGNRNTGDAFTSFIDSRQKAESPVTLASPNLPDLRAVSTMQVRREDLVPAKRWVEERKRMAFSSVPNFDRVAPIQSIPESDIQEYQRNLERLDQVLVNMERYIHIAFAAMKKGEVVERLFKMMASAKSQLEELKKPNPRYVLELHTIRGMIQEADNMDEGLKVVLQKTQQAHVTGHGGFPSAPQPPPQPPSASTSALFAQSVVPTAPPATDPVSRPPHAPPLQPAHRKKQSQAQAISTPTPPSIAVASTSTSQANIPSITAPSPQTPKSSKGEAAPKAKPSARRKASTKAASVETPTPAHIVVSTSMSSTALDGKGGVKRAREDDTDAPTPGVTSAPSPKRVKADWEGP